MCVLKKAGGGDVLKNIAAVSLFISISAVVVLTRVFFLSLAFLPAIG